MPIDPSTVTWDAPKIDPASVKWDEPSVFLADVPEQAIQNLPASAAKFAGDIYTAVTNPVQTVKGLADLAAGGLRAGAQRVLPEAAFQFLDQLDNPETRQRISQTASAAGGMLADRYGSWERIKRTMATDPVAALSDMSALLGVGALTTPGRVSNVLARTSSAIDPLMITGRAGVGGVNALRTAAQNVPDPRAALNRALQPYVDPGAAAVNRFVSRVEDPAAAAAAMRATQNAFVTPGAPPLSAAERMVQGGAPSLGAASLERGLADSSPNVALQMRARELQQQSAIQQQLARVEQQIQTQAATMAPADMAQLRQVRDNLMRAVAEERTALANTAQGVAQPLPTVSQQAVGGQVQQRGQELARQFQRETVSPAYQRAFEAAGAEPNIDLGRSMAAAERLVGDIGALIDPTQVSPGVRNMLRLDADPTAGPPVVTLEDFQAVRGALNSQYSAARRTDPARARSLQSVIRQMDADLAAAPLPPRAVELYRDANRVVSGQQVPRFRTGETSKMLGTTTRNTPGTLPSKQVASFLANEDAAAQFVRTFERDPRALQSMQQGVLDLYRRKIVNPTTRAVDPAEAAAFEAKYANQLDTLEAAGLNVRETMGQVRQDATAVQRALDALTREAKKFGAARSADAVVDQALKSPMDMRFVRDRLSPQARTALSDELANRAATLIQNGDAAGALKYLTANKKALTVGFGKEGAKTYANLLDLAKMQEKFKSVMAQAPKADLITPVKLSEEFTPAQLTDIQVVADDLARTRAVSQLGTPKDREVGSIATEGALEAGASPSRIPGFFIPIVTASKSALKSILDIQDKRVAAALFDKMIRDPDSLIPVLEAAAKTEAAKPPRVAPRPLTIPVGVERAARGATALGVQNRLLESQNENAMAR